MSDLVRLTNRECAVLLRLAIGETFKGAATYLHVAPSTAKRLAQNAYAKLDVSDMNAAVAIHGFHKDSRGRSCYVLPRPLPEAEMRDALAMIRAFKDRGWDVHRSSARHPK